MAACQDTLVKGVQATCNALKRVGGISEDVWLGAVDDLAAVTFGTYNEITSFTWKSTKGFVKYKGKREKNSSGSDIEPGENVNLRNQTLNMAIYYETAEDLDTIDKLIDAQKVFAVVLTNPGSLEVFGINKVNFQNYGLKATTNPQSSGLLLNDVTAFQMALSGGFTNLQLIYKEGTALATAIAALDAQTIDLGS